MVEVDEEEEWRTKTQMGVSVRTIIETDGEKQDPELEKIRARQKEKHRDTAFRPDVWADPPI